MNNKTLKITIFSTLIFCVACNRIDTAELPDLDTPSFSTENVLAKQKIIEKQKISAHKLNKTGNKK